MSGMSAGSDSKSALVGRVALVTGAARRIGAAIVRGLHAQGADVCIHCHRSVQAGQRLAAELNAERANSALLIEADILDGSAPARIVKAAVDTFGRLDLLVNNASTFYPTPIGGITPAHWDDLMGTNLRAPLFLSQEAAPHLRKTQGLIVNMIDIHGQRPLPRYPVYSTAKAGLAMLTRSLARELAPEVRVNGIAPGPILWPDGELEETFKKEIVSKTLLKRMGSPEDIVKAVLFFAKDATYVTGQILAIDGGRSV